ncbi:MAG TPA: ABC transporter ATP-binding protein [Desulfocapsa sulfexigens]|nr:ABC transporter ATP-binding protein [Desulfocapsa sulfexigens]
MALIETKNLSKNYHLGASVVHALASVNLTVARGEFVAICGPSGSGKTTLLNLMGVIDAADEGEMLFKGKDVSGLSDNHKTELRNNSIGFVFQKFNLIPVLTALENVMLPLQIQSISPGIAKTIAMDRLKQVGISDFAGHRPDKMSGGQQQRVAVARALVINPSLVIADEPTANLDSVTAKSIIDLMHDINRTQGTTFVFSTHDQRLLDRVQRKVILKDGRINGGENNG